MRPAVIFDMDGTLADCSHRLHWVRGVAQKNWKKFFEGVSIDKPRPEIVKLAQELALNNAILIASGRPENLRNVTVRWLKKYQVPFDELYLRPLSDHGPDGELKTKMLRKMEKAGYSPWLAIDDRQTAVDAWRENGICCLQCEDGDY